MRPASLLVALLFIGCASEESASAELPAARGPEHAHGLDRGQDPGHAHVHAHDAPSPTPTANGAHLHGSEAAERAPFEVDGDLVRVNNTLCATSRSPMAPDALGQFVSRVAYVGQNPAFQGRTFEFNQCCGGCVARFPTLWAENADEILAYHGVRASSEPL